MFELTSGKACGQAFPLETVGDASHIPFRWDRCFPLFTEDHLCCNALAQVPGLGPASLSMLSAPLLKEWNSACCLKDLFSCYLSNVIESLNQEQKHSRLGKKSNF